MSGRAQEPSDLRSRLSRRRLLAATAALAGLPGCAGLDARLAGLFGFATDSDEAWTVYRARHEDTLIELARTFRLGYVEFQAANPGVDPWLPGEGTELRVPTLHLLPDGPRRGILVNVGDMRVYHFAHEDAAPRHYPIGIGREGHDTPLGSTRVVRKRENPTWYPPASVRREKPDLPRAVPPGPDNPLGSHALYLAWPQYLVHGTNIPWSVGRRQSNGCIRLYPEDIAELYAATPVGTPVTVVDQPVKAQWLGGRLWVEAHPTLAQANEIEETGRFTPEFDTLELARVLAVAGAHGDAVDLGRVEQVLVERRGYPVAVTPPLSA